MKKTEELKLDESIAGSVEVLNSLQITEECRGFDAASKEILKNKEILAVILKHVVREYQRYSYQEVIRFIEANSISSPEVSPGRTHTRISGENKEYQALNEKTSYFDVLFSAVNPELSDEKVIIKLHMDVESQKDYKPGYPIEKRGIYYLSRGISSQLSPVITKDEDYNNLEKCYTIWICRDNIAEKERYSISYYEMTNVRNHGECRTRKEDYDLMSMVILRLGDKEYTDDVSVLKFLSLIMYPSRKNLLEELSGYIDFKDNEVLKKEVIDMSGIGYRVYQEGKDEGRNEGREAIVLNMLKKGYTCEQIAEMTDIPLDIIQKIEEKNVLPAM